MGAVFQGTDETLAGREVAIKFMTLGRDETALKRFQREAEVTAQLDHPHVIRIHGAGRHGDQAYLVYELVAGGTSLEDSFHGAALDQRLTWLEQVASGLSAAHARGIVHRDLKPENVLVRPNGEAVVLDFGLAGLDASSLTNTGQVLGTPAYMSPEQVRGEPATPACDVWCLGLLLYEALYERHAFLEEGITLPALLAKVYSGQTEFPRGPAPGLRRLVQRCLDQDPAKRPADGAAFALALDEARAGGEGKPSLWFGVVALVLLASVIGALALGRPSPAPQQSQRASPRSSASSQPSPTPAKSPSVTPQPSKARESETAARGKRRLPEPEFVLSLKSSRTKQARFLSNEELLFVGQGGRAQIYRVGRKTPTPTGPAWQLPIFTDDCRIDSTGLRVVVVSGDRAWRLELPDHRAIPLPPLPFVPQEVHFWERGSRFYLLVADSTRVACGVLGAPLRELDVSGYEVKEAAGAVNRVVLLVRKGPLRKPGLLVFNIGGEGPIWLPTATPSAIVQSPEADRVFVGSRFGSLALRSSSTSESQLLAGAHEGSLRHVDWVGRRLAALSKRTLSVWSEEDLSRPLYLDALPPGTKADEVTLSPRGDLVVVRRNSEFLGWRLPD